MSVSIYQTTWRNIPEDILTFQRILTAARAVIHYMPQHLYFLVRSKRKWLHYDTKVQPEEQAPRHKNFFTVRSIHRNR
jgi:hypothetical protein